jgi:hypothetical protein
MLAQRNECYSEMDTVGGFDKRLEQAGFSRVMTPFVAGFLGVVVGFSGKESVTVENEMLIKQIGRKIHFLFPSYEEQETADYDSGEG